jgi:N6-adenosine-specific RNA methylase IME4
MSEKFSIIVSDPPWLFADQLTMSNVKRGASSNYSTMTNSEIAQLPVKDICNPDGALLALWVPSSILEDGLLVMKAYGFTLKQSWIWVKTKKDPFKNLKKKLKKSNQIDWDQIDWNDFLSFGLGRLGRNMHEVVLIGTRGKIYKNLKNKSQRTVFFAPAQTKHSQKPEILQDKLELMFPGESVKKLEMFGRRSRPGWRVIGNEALDTMGQDIRDSLAALK